MGMPRGQGGLQALMRPRNLVMRLDRIQRGRMAQTSLLPTTRLPRTVFVFLPAPKGCLIRGGHNRTNGNLVSRLRAAIAMI